MSNIYKIAPFYHKYNQPVNNFDYSQCLDGICEMYPLNAMQDIVRSFIKIFILSKESSVKVVEAVLTNCKEQPDRLYDSHFNYMLDSELITRLHTGEWWTNDYLVKGQGALSLVKYIKICTDLEALLFVAEILGIDFTERKICQNKNIDGYTFIDNPIMYPYDYIDNSIINFFCKPLSTYTFYDKNENDSFYLHEWIINNEPVQLFYALYQNDKTGTRSWEHILPPYKYIIYNRNLIDGYINRDIHIHTDIARSDLSNTDYSTGTWSGDASISSMLEWDLLKGRNVTLIFDKYNLISMKISFELIQKFIKKKLIFSLYGISDSKLSKSIMYSLKSKDTASNFHDGITREIGYYNLCKIKAGNMSFIEFLNFAKIHYGIDLMPKEEEVKKFPTTISDLDKIETDTSFIVYPLFKEGAYILITAKQKVGKSIFAMDIAYMIAAGESIGNQLSSKKSYKVLYIDSEMPTDGFKERAISLKSNYNNKNLIDDNFNFCLLRDRGVKLDLTTSKDQKFVEDLIEGHKFIVFDNLDGLTNDAALHSRSWAVVSSWFKSLTSRGITVFLVHHENEAGEKRGIGKITDDVDMSISLKKPNSCPVYQAIIEFKIMDSRYPYGKQCDSFEIEYRTENNETLRTIRPLGTVFNDNDKTVVVSEIKSQPEPADLESDLLDPVRHAELLYIVPRMFIVDGDSGRSRSTVKAVIKKLRESGLLIRKDIKQVAKYVLKENLAEYRKRYEPPYPSDEKVTEMPVNQVLPISDLSQIEDE